jgi:uncharacterized protein YktA (UPF0223 family)
LIKKQESGYSTIRSIAENKQIVDLFNAGDKLGSLWKQGLLAGVNKWFFGDLQAVEKAFSINLKNQKNKALFRDPDNIQNAKQELKKLAPKYQQVSGSQSISKFMNIAENKSPSFQIFISGVKK